jgi:phosphatidate phosphatase APP1
LTRIETILADLPSVRFVLSGDDGERDPEVFKAIRERYPSRIDAIYIRRVSGDPARPAYPGQLTPP